MTDDAHLITEHDLGVLTEPLKGYEELSDILDPVTGRLYGIGNVIGLTIEEAAAKAQTWWDEKARQSMPDYKTSLENLNSYGIKSGIMLGRPWAELNRGEKIQVTKIWHTHIGLPMYGMGLTNKKDLKNVLIDIQKEFAPRRFDLPGIFGRDN